MFPNLFSIGPFVLHTYGLFVALGFFVGLSVTVRMGKTEGISSQMVMDMGFIIIFSALVASRLMYILMNIAYYRQHPIDIFKLWQGGLVFSGGVMGVLLTMAWYVKRHSLSFWKTGDLWAPAVALGQGIGRIGCLMAGCCYGRPTDVNWAIVFTNPGSLADLNIPLHPTQIYSSLSGFIIFSVLMLLRRKKRFEGQVLVWFLILHSTARLFVERFRGDARGTFLSSNLSTTQFIASLILVASVVMLFVLKSRARKELSSPGTHRP